jgi:hypothetical protein
VTTSCSDKEQSGRSENSSVDRAERRAGHEEGHDPGHHPQQPVSESLKENNIIFYLNQFNMAFDIYQIF